MTHRPAIHAFFHEPTNTVSYLLADPDSKMAAVIDPVLDYEQASSTVDTVFVDNILAEAQRQGYQLLWCLETHVHADHLSASPYVKAKTGAQIGIGSGITEVQRIFRPVFDATDLVTDGNDFDRLFADGELFAIGGLRVNVMHLPGHTPADIAYRVDDDVFVGDTIFMPDYGTARTDFPGGDARTLYRSIQRLLALSPETRLHMCHDYKAPGRDHYAWDTTVAEERNHNIHLRNGVTEDQFVAMRNARDAGLATPRLLLPSIQTNMRAGKFPPAEQNGVRYLKIPVRFKNMTASV